MVRVLMMLRPQAPHGLRPLYGPPGTGKTLARSLPGLSW
jgi:ATP-dependent 26S proteasome regulatory subunit